MKTTKNKASVTNQKGVTQRTGKSNNSRAKQNNENHDLGEDTTMKEREEEQKRPAPKEEL